MVRPSYVLGGRAMAVVYDDSTLERYMHEAADVSPGHPVLIDRFLEDAFEVDLDLISRRQDRRRRRHPPAHRGGGHPLRRLGGGAAAVQGLARGSGPHARHRPPAGAAAGRGRADERAVRPEGRQDLRPGGQPARLAHGAVHRQGGGGAAGQDRRRARWPGKTLQELGFTAEPRVPGVFVKAPVFPFRRFPGVDPVLGPEMKSTGEVMGESLTFGNAFAKAWMGAGHQLPLDGHRLPLRPRPRQAGPAAGRPAPRRARLRAGGHRRHRRRTCSGQGLAVRTVLKVHEARPHIVDLLINGEIALVVNTPLGRESHEDDGVIRRTALKYDIPCITTLSGAMAAAEGIAALKREGLSVRSLQEMAAS